MGWATGSKIAEDIWCELKPVLNDEQRKYFSKFIYNKFNDFDADDWTWEENALEYDAYLLNNPDEWRTIDNEINGEADI